MASPASLGPSPSLVRREARARTATGYIAYVGPYGVHLQFADPAWVLRIWIREGEKPTDADFKLFQGWVAELGVPEAKRGPWNLPGEVAWEETRAGVRTPPASPPGESR